MEFRPDGTVLVQTALSMSRLSHEELPQESAEIARFVRLTAERTFLVVSATCSHEACLITDMDGKIFVCPCHGSRFDGQGNVLTGPAELPLFAFEWSYANDVLTIAL